jgi:hypothetical protein
MTLAVLADILAALDLALATPQMDTSPLSMVARRIVEVTVEDFGVERSDSAAGPKHRYSFQPEAGMAGTGAARPT